MYNAISFNYYSDELNNKSMDVITAERGAAFDSSIEEIELNKIIEILIHYYIEGNFINYSGLAKELEVIGNVYIAAIVFERIAVESYRKNEIVDVELIKAISDIDLLNNMLNEISFGNYTKELNNESIGVISSKAGAAFYSRIRDIELNIEAVNLIQKYYENNLINYSGLAKELEVSKNIYLATKVVERLAIESYKKDGTVDVKLINAITSPVFLRYISNIVSFSTYIYELDYNVDTIASAVGAAIFSKL